MARNLHKIQSLRTQINALNLQIESYMRKLKEQDDLHAEETEVLIENHDAEIEELNDTVNELMGEVLRCNELIDDLRVEIDYLNESNNESCKTIATVASSLFNTMVRLAQQEHIIDSLWNQTILPYKIEESDYGLLLIKTGDLIESLSNEVKDYMKEEEVYDPWQGTWTESIQLASGLPKRSRIWSALNLSFVRPKEK